MRFEQLKREYDKNPEYERMGLSFADYAHDRRAELGNDGSYVCQTRGELDAAVEWLEMTDEQRTVNESLGLNRTAFIKARAAEIAEAA